LSGGLVLQREPHEQEPVLMQCSI